MSYEPTGGDGRYARLYVRDLEPTSVDEQAADSGTLAELVDRLDLALAGEHRVEAIRLIRTIRVIARVSRAAAPASDEGRQRRAEVRELIDAARGAGGSR
jgi:hypothetical protein